MNFVFDTGMLIALERRKARAWEAFRAITRRDIVPIVPAVVYVEWWRGRSDMREAILSAVHVDGMSTHVCRAAGEALAALPSATIVDAIVMASASLRGDAVVYTGDYDDLARLQGHFPFVRVLRI